MPPSSGSATPTPPVGGLDLQAVVSGEARHSFEATLKSPTQQQSTTSHSPSAQDHLEQNHQRSSVSSSQLNNQQQQQHQSHTQRSLHSTESTPNSPTTVNTTTAVSAAGVTTTMPIGGVQGQNPTQGLVHWMSAVMAEHMTGQTHHDPTAVGMHYMWNGNMDVSKSRLTDNP